MKNIFFKSAALIAVLTMTMSGCSNEELTGDKGQTEMEGISSITLETPQGGPSTRLEYNTDNITQALGVKWKAGKWTGASSVCERAFGVNAAYNLLYGFILVRDDEGGPTSKAEFIFANHSQGATKPLYKDSSFGLLYPYKSDYSAAFDLNGSSVSTVEATLPLNGQTGVLADMQNFDYMTTLGTVPSGGNVSEDKDLSVTFKHRIAVMRLTGLTFPAGTAGTATSIAISGTGLMTDAKLTFTKGAGNTLTESLVLGSTEGAITTTGTFNITNNVLGDVYICFFPGNIDATGTHQITDLKVTATVGSDTYEYNYGGDNAVTNKVEKFVEGKMYTLSGKAMMKKEAAIEWATGNLVAKADGSGCEIGASTDGGLYFQFGSLIGWAGGASGDGTGVPASNTLRTARGIVAPSGESIPATWADDPNRWTGGTTAAETVPATNDPCTHYLGSGWRLPTTDEYKTLFNNTTNDWTDSGGWSWDTSSTLATHTDGKRFPASGYRNDYDGTLSQVRTIGYCWSASPNDAGNGCNLYFRSSLVNPSNYGFRERGLPVRCVRASN